MKNTDWLIVDTETDGLIDPIHVVEIAAQRMKGWEPVGDKFRVLLNHNVPIPSAAVAIHGYTQEFLRENGVDPLQAHASFRDFAGSLPMVAHNLSFDWNRVLYPEWMRLGIPQIGQRGFCSLMLSRRLVDETKSYSMDALRRTFGISSHFAHRAFGDVDSLATLFAGVFQPRLVDAGIVTFSDVLQFSSRTPVAKCLCAMRSKTLQPTQNPASSYNDSWYFIDPNDQTHGPLPAAEVLGCTGGMPCWVWKEGLPDWVSSQTNDEFSRAHNAGHSSPAGKPRTKRSQSHEELLEVCDAILADRIVSPEEVMFLSRWLEGAGVITEWPLTELAETVERIMADGVLTDAECEELQSLLGRIKASGYTSDTCAPDRGRPEAASKARSEAPGQALETKVGCQCGQHIVVEPSASGQEFVCPCCGRSLCVPTLSQVAPPALSETPELATAARPASKLELMCVGNAGSGYINAQIQVLWFEVLVVEARKRVDVIEHSLPIKSHRREKRVNICEYDVPEGVVCFYDRHIQTKPNLHERRFFRIEDGQFHVLGEGAQCDFYTRFLTPYRDYDICSGSSQKEVEENRNRRGEMDKLGPGIHIVIGSDSKRETRMPVIQVTPVVPAPKPATVQLSTHQQAFALVRLTQGTPEWLLWREQGIGASDAPAIMNESPWKSRGELLNEKCGWAPPTEVNYAMSRGTALEPEARQAYISQTGQWVEPACLQSTAYDWLRASVDGLTPTLDGVVEIKCGRSVYRTTSETGRPPDHYYAQLQHILAVTGLPSLDFWCYLPGLPQVLVPVNRDDSYIARLLEAESQFWSEVVRRNRGTPSLNTLDSQNRTGI